MTDFNLRNHHLGIYCYSIEESVKFYEEVLGFKLLYTTSAMEGDKPLKMAWIGHPCGLNIELLEQEDKSVVDANKHTQNHFTFRVDDVDAFVEHLQKHNVTIEAGPFDADMAFGPEITDSIRKDLFRVSGPKGAKLKILFFRGPGNERFEVLEDTIGSL